MQGRAWTSIGLEKSNALLVSLLLADEPDVSGLLLDLSADEASVRFSLTRCPDLAIRQEVELRFTSDRLDRPLLARARVTRRTEEPDSRSYGFRFTDYSDFQHLSPDIRRLLNRRGSNRVQPNPELPVKVTLGAGRDGQRYPVRLVDISATGARFRVSGEVESALLETRRIAISMSFPDCGHPVELYGIICHRGVAGTEIDYGIAFESESASGPRHQDAITAYVTKRRGEIMQRSTAA